MIIKFKNAELGEVHEVLSVVHTKGRKARAVAKFMKLIQIKRDEFGENQMDIVDEFNGDVDDLGNISWLESNEVEARQLMYELAMDDVIIDLTEYEPFLEYLNTALYEDIDNLSGNSLTIYDELLSKLESITEIGDD